MWQISNKNRVEERAKESQKAKEKNYEDYAWKHLCEDPIKLKKPRVPELNKQLKQTLTRTNEQQTATDLVNLPYFQRPFSSDHTDFVRKFEKHG